MIMKGWRTIVFMILTAALAGVDSLVDYIDIPQWYFLYIVPFVGVILRFLTDSPVGKK